MIFKKIVLSFLCCLLSTFIFAQTNYSWYNPLQSKALSGRVISENLAAYNRLPNELEEKVRKPVWALGTNSAGLSVRFTSDATDIKVRYKVKGAHSMPHMPATGVSGVDLYAFDKETNSWKWAIGNYSFADTVTYSFIGIGSNNERVYELYLPLYNTVEWMEIGVPAKNTIVFERDEEQPIVIYGTSIAQGACASRPGLAWTNILQRHLRRPVVNLAFSGNGRLEQPILELMVQQDAAVFVLDCLPNLVLGEERDEVHLDSLIMNAVQFLKSKKPETPIILTETSAGFNPDILNHAFSKQRELTTSVARKVFNRLENRGVKNIYRLSNADIGLDIESTVDFSHPNDLGMMKIADAYRKLLRIIPF